MVPNNVRSLEELLKLPDEATVNEKEAAMILPWSVRTLQMDRTRGTRSEIPFHKLGKTVYYTMGELRDVLRRE